MALTRIKTGGLTDNSVTDAKVADAITVTGAQTGITQVGTLTAGVWNGTAIASAYLDADTAHLSGSAFTGTISSSTSSTTDSALTLTDAGVADYKFTFPDTSTIRLSTSTSSTKVFDLSNAGSGKMKLSVDGGLRPITGSDYSLVLESTNELNFYNADGYAEGNKATLHINYSGTGSTVDLSNSELVVVKGTGSTFAGGVTVDGDRYMLTESGTNKGFFGKDDWATSGGSANDVNVGSYSGVVKLTAGAGTSSTPNITCNTDKTVTTAGDFQPGADIQLQNGRGISFANMPNAGGMTSELLDDYEEGAISTSVNGITASTNDVSGTYTKVGRVVHLEVRVTISGKSGGTGNPYITLPFNASGAGIGASIVGAQLSKNTIISGGSPAFLGLYGSTNQVYANDVSGSYIGDGDWGNGVMGFSLVYNT